MSLTAFDVIAIAVIGLSTLLALGRGFVREVFALLAWVGAVAAAIYAFPLLQPMLREAIAEPTIADVATAALAFIVPLIALRVLGGMIASALSGFGFGGLDRLLGLVFGLARGALVVCLAYLALGFVFGDESQQPAWIRDARVTPYVRQGAAELRTLLPEGSEDEGRRTAEEMRGRMDSARDALPDLNTPGLPPAGTPPEGRPLESPGGGADL